MATKPSTLPKVWASLLNYDNGPFIGSPMKVAPPDPVAASGHRPGSLFPTPAEYENYQQNQLCSWIVNWVNLGASTGAANAHLVETDASGFTQVQKLSAINTIGGGAIIATAGNATGITATTTGASNPVFRGINLAGGDIISGALGGSTGSFLQCDLSGSSFGLELTANGASKPIDVVSSSSNAAINIASSGSKGAINITSSSPVLNGVVSISSSSDGATGLYVEQISNVSNGIVVSSSGGTAILSNASGATTAEALRASSINGNGITTSSVNLRGIRATSVHNDGAEISSTDGIGAQISSTNSIALLATGNSGGGIIGQSTNADAILGTSTSGRGIVGSTTSGNAGAFFTSSGIGVLAQSASNWAVQVQGDTTTPAKGEMRFIGQDARPSNVSSGQLSFLSSEKQFAHSSNDDANWRGIWSSTPGYAFGQYYNPSSQGPYAAGGAFQLAGSFTFPSGGNNPKIPGLAIIRIRFEVRSTTTGIATFGLQVRLNGAILPQANYSNVAGTGDNNGFTYDYSTTSWENIFQLVVMTNVDQDDTLSLWFRPDATHSMALRGTTMYVMGLDEAL